MVGAGISCNAGIPDFRTPGTGLYDNLQQYNIPYPEAVFDMAFFRTNPAPFYKLCKELWPGNYEPTITHRFISMLNEKGLLLRCYSQNIDSLETQAGLPSEKLVAAHGNFDSASCIDTGKRVPIEEVREACLSNNDEHEGWEKLKSKYGGLVKPDIVFFGEALPSRFHRCAAADFSACDLLIVMGTSLVVRPFADLINLPQSDTARVLINKEKAGEEGVGMWFRGFKFDGCGRDLFLQGDCDKIIQELIEELGWDLGIQDKSESKDVSDVD